MVQPKITDRISQTFCLYFEKKVQDNMKTNLCNGFMYETEEELQELVGIEEYLDMKFNKGSGDWEPDLDDDSDTYELHSLLTMDVYCKRKADGLTQRETWYWLGDIIED